jgi:hypothetical protein
VAPASINTSMLAPSDAATCSGVDAGGFTGDIRARGRDGVAGTVREQPGHAIGRHANGNSSRRQVYIVAQARRCRDDQRQRPGHPRDASRRARGVMMPT